MAAGGLAMSSGHYVRRTLSSTFKFPELTVAQLSIMILGEALCTVGSGLLITLDFSTSTVQWAAYMALTGLGDGLAANMPYTAVQAILDNEGDVFIGNAFATFGALAGGGIGVGIGSNLLRNTLFQELPKQGVTISPQVVIEAGAIGLGSLTSDPSVLKGLVESFSLAVRATNIGATVAVGVSVLLAFGMQWLSLKNVADARDGKHERPLNGLSNETMTEMKTLPTKV